MPSKKYDVIIIGAGIVGLATAYKITKEKPSLKIGIIEKEARVATHQTGHNSGVIHSGIYYKPGSLKALNCRNGYHLLLAFAKANRIPHEVCGKVIVATKKEELPILQSIYKKGVENGLEGLKIIDKKELLEKEPHVNGIQAIWVPQAGIINYKEVSQSIAGLLSHHDTEFIFNQQVQDIIQKTDSLTVQTKNLEIETKLAINCAGLYADKIGKLTEPERKIQIIPFRGEYYVLKKEKESLVNNLIYPVPDPAFPFLGVHFTRMIEGGIEAGPNAVLAFRREGYKRHAIHPAELAETFAFAGFRKLAAKYWKTGLGEIYRSFSKPAFVKALQHLIPTISSDDLRSGGAGVRAMACDQSGQLIDDFFITHKGKVVNVWNAPSPAATSCLAIGDTIAKRALDIIH